MIRKDKLNNFIERVMGDCRPITADIFLTDFCNNHCRYCRFSHKKNGTYISLNDFIQYAERLLSFGVRGFILTGGGEPSVNPDFGKICCWLESHNIDYGINTNMNILRYVKPNFIKVSIDTGNKDEYKHIRGVDAFDTVLDNVSKYASWKKYASPRTRLGVQCLALSADQVVSFYEAIQSLAVDYIQFRPLETVGKNLDYTAILEAIESIHDSRIIKSFKFDLLDFRTTSCIANWSVITLNTRGEIVYCCHKPDEIVGHILDNDILCKLRTHHTDMRRCEIPCRLSSANHFLANFTTENDINFI